MNYNRTKTNILETKKINIALVAFVFFSMFVYLYSYQSSISYASTIENLEDKISNLKSQISEVEFQIVESKRSLNKNIAIKEGYVALDEVVFIKKTSKTALNAITN
jgi:cell division protein FtsL